MAEWTADHDQLFRICRAVGARSDALSARHLATLLALYRVNAALTFRELASAVGCPKASTTRMHQTLTRLGFARRWTDPLDGRNCYIEITDVGREFVLSVMQTEARGPAARALG